jgi:hypothetical protein
MTFDKMEYLLRYLQNNMKISRKKLTEIKSEIVILHGMKHKQMKNFGSSGAIIHFDYPMIIITATLFPLKRLALLTNSISFKPCIF